MDIARTQGDLNGLSEAKKTHPEMSADELRKTDVYKAEMAKYGTGSAIQQGLQAATAAVQGLAGGDLAKAIAGGSAPYLAEVIHNMTTDPVTGKVNTEANLMAHAVVGAVVAQINGNSTLAGASGAAMGEFIAQQLYPNIKREDLTEEQRQTISSLSTLAAGLAGGLTGDSSADTVAGAQAGKNSSENNNLSLPSGMMDYGQAATSWNQYAVDNNLTPEQTQAGLNKLAQGDLPEGANIAKAIVDGYVDGVFMAGAFYLGPTVVIGKGITGAVIGGGANSAFQYINMTPDSEFSYYSAAVAAGAGYLAPGYKIGGNTLINMGGAFMTDGPDLSAQGGAIAGSLFGGGVGKYVPMGVDKLIGKELPGFIYDIGAAFTFETANDASKEMLKDKKDKQ